MDRPLPAPTVQWALFGWRGRIGRRTFILGQLFMLSLFGIVFARILAVRGDESATIFWGLAMFALIGVSAWSSLALTIKRLHDLSLPGIMALILLVPTVNFIFVIALMVMPSKNEVNDHGPPPFGLQPPQV